MTNIEKKVIVFTVKESDAHVLEHLLTNISDKCKYHVRFKGAFTAAVGGAKTALIQTNHPVILIIDTNTTNEADIWEKESFVNISIGKTLYKNKFKPFFIVPELEVVLINNKNVLEQALNKQIPDDLWRLAKYAPAKALEEIFHQDKNFFAGILQNEMFRKELQKDPLIRDIVEFAEHADPNSM